MEDDTRNVPAGLCANAPTKTATIGAAPPQRQYVPHINLISPLTLYCNQIDIHLSQAILRHLVQMQLENLAAITTAFPDLLHKAVAFLNFLLHKETTS